MSIYHIATARDWRDAASCGSYTTSTLGRSLAQEGFIHASRAEQWRGVLERFYSGADEPLVLLEIDPGLLGCPVVEEQAAPDVADTFPHICGAVPSTAVVSVTPLLRD